MIADPPLDAGAVHDTVACPLPGTADTPVGVPGGPAAVTGAEAVDCGPTPAAFVALTVNVYAVPPTNPVTASDLADAAAAAVAPPGNTVTV